MFYVIRHFIQPRVHTSIGLRVNLIGSCNDDLVLVVVVVCVGISACVEIACGRKCTCGMAWHMHLITPQT